MFEEVIEKLKARADEERQKAYAASYDSQLHRCQGREQAFREAIGILEAASK